MPDIVSKSPLTPSWYGGVGALDPEHLGYAVIPPGRVPAVDRDRLTAHERGVGRDEEQRDRADLLGTAEPLQLVLAPDRLAHLFHPRHAEHAVEQRRLDEPRTDRVRTDTDMSVVDREVLGEDDDR